MFEEGCRSAVDGGINRYMLQYYFMIYGIIRLNTTLDASYECISF